MFEIDDSLMSKDASLWKNEQSFISTKEIVKTLLSVNDSAERGVKLTSVFLHLARKEERFQDILQVVEDDGKKCPNLRGPKKARFASFDA